ncbi:unnamed protein product [Rhodiola kirilowii]
MDSSSLSSSSAFSFRCFSKPSLFASRNPQTTLRCSLLGGDFSPNNNNVLAIQDKVTPILDCVVVGAGISGLTIAQALSTRHNHNNFILTEARDRAGGNIITVETDGYLWEQGPNSFQPTDPMLTLAVDSGLKDDLVFGDPDAPRFVLWNGKLRPVPSKPADFPFFDLMSLGGKLRAAFGALGIRPPPPDHEESIEEFVRRNLGDEVFERLIEPFCSGVYAGDPSKLSMKAAFGKVWKLEQNGGSIIGGALGAFRGRSSSSIPTRDPRLPKPKGQTVGSFRKGLAMLPDAISARLGSKLKLSWRLTNIKKLHSGEYCLTYETPGGPITVQSKSVVLTVPSHVASSLLQPLSHVAADLLSKFYYPPVAAVSVSYSKDSVRPECLMDGELKGFGQLHPRSQGIETLAQAINELFVGSLIRLAKETRTKDPWPYPSAQVAQLEVTAYRLDSEQAGPLDASLYTHQPPLYHTMTMTHKASISELEARTSTHKEGNKVIQINLTALSVRVNQNHEDVLKRIEDLTKIVE